MTRLAMLVCYCGYATVYLYRYIQFYSKIYLKSFEENGLKTPDVFICYNHYQLPPGLNVNKFCKLY